jgi:pimeloyl-ACP methyl ester carboxylesterase
MTAIAKRAELPDRVKLSYVEQGEATGVPMLLLHGYTDSWHSYSRVLPQLPRTVHAYALSQRGHGDSDRPADGYHTRDFAADLANFMDALNIGPAVIVGHSMGSLIAQRFAIDYPDRVLGVVLVGSFVSLKNNDDVKDFWNTTLSKLGDTVEPELAIEFQRSTLARPVPQEFFDTVVQESLKFPARLWKKVLKELMEEDHTEELNRIKAPTLIIWGDQDVFVRRSDQQILATSIPNSQLSIYEGTGHSPQWEEPDRFTAEILAFTEKLVEAI